MDIITMKHLAAWIDRTIVIQDQEDTMRTLVNFWNNQDNDERERLGAYSWRQILTCAERANH